MGKTKTKSGKKNKTDSAVGGKKADERLMLIDPDRVRFQHSRIRPYFSGCGRGVRETLEQIRNKEISPDDLPHIQVLMGPDEMDGKGPWYFGLNNRRLWVLKKCKEEGLLNDTEGLIKARIRSMKSHNEHERYTLENCALQAKFIYDPKHKKKKQEEAKVNESETAINEEEMALSKNLFEMSIKSKDINEGTTELSVDIDEDDESSDDEQRFSNRFSGLM